MGGEIRLGENVDDACVVGEYVGDEFVAGVYSLGEYVEGERLSSNPLSLSDCGIGLCKRKRVESFLASRTGFLSANMVALTVRDRPLVLETLDSDS